MSTRDRHEMELLLAEHGPAVLDSDPELRAWVEGDDDAVALLESLVVLDDAFDGMARGEDLQADDAPDHVVAALLARPELRRDARVDASDEDADPEVSETRRSGRILPWVRNRSANAWQTLRRHPQLLAAAAVLMVVGGLLLPVHLRTSQPMGAPESVVAQSPAPEATEEMAEREMTAEEIEERRRLLEKQIAQARGASGYEPAFQEIPVPDPTPDADAKDEASNRGLRQMQEEIARLDRFEEERKKEQADASREIDADEMTFGDSITVTADAPLIDSQAISMAPEPEDETVTVTSESPLLDERKISRDNAVTQLELEKIPTARDPWAVDGTLATEDTDTDEIDSRRSARSEGGAAGYGAAGYGAADEGDKNDGVGGKAKENEQAKADEPAEIDPALADQLVALGYLGGSEPSTTPTDETERLRDLAAAEHYLAQRNRTEGLVFQEAAGYWRNPWVPGDPALRILRARLDAAAGTLPEPLHDLARRSVPPLDAPEHGALALDLQADRLAVDGPTRTTLQVGLRAADAWAGRRTAMRLAVVVHLPAGDVALATETAAALRAVLDALAAHHDLGDQFHVVVAGRPGGVAVDADGFRHGALRVLAEDLLAEDVLAAGDPNRAPEQPTFDIARAFDAAVGLVATQDGEGSEDDSVAPLGSSAVLVVTTGGLEVDPLLAAAHRASVAGTRVSALGVGPGGAALAADLERLAAAGQGSRRLVPRAAEADAQVEAELVQAARAVARAVRLRIRLAPGVRLVDVLGSERLDARAADRVREAERSVDQRLARRLGIVADRGDDEEGIQIVVPAIYAGDVVTVLLDVVVPGPGPAADVTVRYKDLVRMDNGVARDHLELRRAADLLIDPADWPADLGPLQRAVFDARLAHDVRSCLDDAATVLERYPGETGRVRAIDNLDRCRTVLRGLELLVPGIDIDLGGTIRRDLRMLDGYVDALASDGEEIGAREALTDSLRYAGLLKILPPPYEASADAGTDT